MVIQMIPRFFIIPIIHSAFYFGLPSVQPLNEIADQFRNLFGSIGKNDDLGKSEIHHLTILEPQEAIERERQAFYTLKQELHAARNRKTHEKLNTHEHVVASITKRGTNGKNRDSDDTQSNHTVLSFGPGKLAFDPSSIDGFNSTNEVSSCYIECDGKFLLLKRRDRGKTNQRWCLPGGGKEKYETPLQAALREVEEETGIKLELAKYFKTLHMRLFHPKRDFLLHLYKATLTSPTSNYTIKLNQEHSEYLWTDLQTAKQLKLLAGGREILDLLSQAPNETDEEAYIFPEIQNGDALQPTMKLLLSQQKYHKRLAVLYEEMWERNKKSPSHGLLGHSIGDSVMVTGELINRNIVNLRGWIENGTASEAYKKEPMDDEDAGSLLESWKFLLEYTSNNELRDYGLDVAEEANEMQKILLLARKEMEVYDTYLDKLYEEEYRTRMARPDNKLFKANNHAFDERK